MIRAIIVDDEPHCIARLSHLLQRHCQQTIELVGSYERVDTTLAGIKDVQPELVFLDVQLQGATGFDLLSQLPSIPFQLIFTTAYERYALEAFKFSAMDYLLKPISESDLLRAIQKTMTSLQKDKLLKQLEVLYSHLHPNKHPSKKISIPTLHGLEFIPVGEILHCQAEANYTILYLRNKQQLLVTKTLKEFEALLGASGFFRVHHSHLVNLDAVKKYQKGKGGYLTMEDGTEIEVSTRRKIDFLKAISEL